MKIIKCVHVTATEKRHLKELFKSGLTGDVRINTKTYSIISSMPYENKTLYKIRISTPMRNDFGDVFYDGQLIEVVN